MICTSGTAVANLHPAMLEAAHAGVRLLAVTADRPARLRGTGANQTTDQVGVFGPLVPYVDLGPGDAAVARTALGLGDGPLHLNVQLDDPLVPAEPVATCRTAAGSQAWRASALVGASPVSVRSTSARAPSWSPATTRVRRRGCWRSRPAGRCSPNPRAAAGPGDAAIRTYRLLLGGPLADEVERVVVFGHPTLSRPVTRLMQRDDVEVLSVPTRGVWSERPFAVAQHLEARPTVEEPDESDWFDRWRAEDRRVGAAPRRAARVTRPT